MGERRRWPLTWGLALNERNKWFAPYHTDAELEQRSFKHIISRELPFWLAIGPMPWHGSYTAEYLGFSARFRSSPDNPRGYMIVLIGAGPLNEPGVAM